MKAKQSSKVRSFQAVSAVFSKHEETWKPLKAFGKGVTDFQAIIPEINSTLQIQSSQSGVTAEKALALEQMGNAAFEIAGAVASFGLDTEDVALEKRVDFSRSAITDGRENDVLARCNDILAAAQANVDSLADYGITQAKLTAFKKKIDAFEALLGKPREAITTSSAATKHLEVLLDRADMVLGRKLDRLSVQFKETAPEFYDSYQAARAIVDSGSRKTSKTTPTPAPQPA